MRKKIDLPFQPEFKERMLSGKKTCTTRTRRYGRSGDYFTTFGKYFVLTEVYPIRLTRVVYFHFEDEGFDSPQAFIECWDKIHPTVKYNDRRDRTVYIHYFQPIKKAYPVAGGP